MLIEALLVFQAVAMAGLIIIGGLVEGYGYGLSLGTRWPYHEKILVLAAKGDPEAWHRIVATVLGLNAVLLVILDFSPNTISGLVLIVITAILGMATLHVLAGKAPSFLQGLHGLLAYTTFITYLLALHARPILPIWVFLKYMVPLHAFLLMIFLGGMVTGQRGFQRPIEGFVIPKTGGQWVFSLHYLAGLLFLLTLAFYIKDFSGALVIALAQFVVGFMLFHSVNGNPRRPGILVAFHQATALLILLAIVYAWQVPLPGLHA